MKNLVLKLSLMALFVPTLAQAQAQDKKETAADKEFARNEREVRAEVERQQKEKQSEAMRDKSHDNRLPVGKDTSVGGTSNGKGAEVNIRKTY